MFVTGELPVDAAVKSRFIHAAHPKRKNPLCFKGTPRNFLSALAITHTPPITEVSKMYYAYVYVYICTFE
jgi:hypothetical protein